MNQRNQCECMRCGSALNTAGYFIALMEFIQEYFGKDSKYLLVDRMHRPGLNSEKLSCECIEKPIFQIEIANKVLIDYIYNKADLKGNSKSSKVYALLKESWNQPPFYYEGTRFKEYLAALGTSISEIHSVLTNPENENYNPKHLAEIIGISYPELNWLTNELDEIKTAKVLGIKKEELHKVLRLIGYWSYWKSLGKPRNVDFNDSKPSVVSSNNNRIDVFVWGNDNNLWHKWFEGNWFEWESLGKPSSRNFSVSNATTISSNINRIDVFVWGTDNKLWHKWFEGSWSNWEPMDGPGDSGLANITAISLTNSRIYIFLEVNHIRPSRYKVIWHKRFDGNLSNWESLDKPSGVEFALEPIAISSNNNRIDIFGFSNDKKLWHRWFDGNWSEWESLGKPSGVEFDYLRSAAVSSNNNRIDIFLWGSDNKLWHKWLDGNWSEWESLGRPSGGEFTFPDPTASWNNNRIDVFIRDNEKKIWHKLYHGQWSEWEPLEKPYNDAFSEPTVVSWNNRIDIFTCDNIQLWHKWYEENLNEKAQIFSNLLGINKNDFSENLLQLSYINVNDMNDILDISTFDKLRRITAISRALGITIDDIVNILTIINPQDLNIEAIEEIYECILICNDMGVSGADLSDFLTDQPESEKQIRQLMDILGFEDQDVFNNAPGMHNPTCDSVSRLFKIFPDEVKMIIGKCNDIKYMDIKKIYRISKFAGSFAIQIKILLDLFNSMDPLINDINSMNNITNVWNLVKQIQSSGISIERFVLLRRSLSDEEFAEHLGKSMKELQSLIELPNLRDEKKLVEGLGISIDELHILFDLNIRDKSDNDIDDVSKLTDLDQLKFLHQPLRLAQALGVNLEELRLILETLGIYPDKDPNKITNVQILHAKEKLSLLNLIGLNVVEIAKVIRDLNDEELRESLGFQYQLLFNWNDFSEIDKDRLIQYLKVDCGIDWVEREDIEKTDSTIYIKKNEKTIEITLNNEKASIKFSDNTIYELIVSIEAGKTNIYSNELTDLLQFKDNETVLRTLSEKLGVQLDDIKNLLNTWEPAQLRNISIISKIYRFVNLAKNVGLNTGELENLLKNLDIGYTDINNYLRVCALAIAPENLVDLLKISGLNEFENVKSYSQVYWLYKINTLANSTGLTLDDLSKLNKWEDEISNDDVDFLDSILKSKYNEIQLENEKKKSDERIRVKTREALLQYALIEIPLKNPGSYRTIEGLSAFLLINLNYSPCNITTEIQQAIESIQTFVIRARAGQELDVTINNESLQRRESEWRWMRSYVLWEAAQKVFLYPENYIMPQLRDDKTPFFKELEDELNQGEVTEAIAAKAMSGYIEKLHAINALRVSGTVYDPETNILHIFARSKINETEAYYRTLKNQSIWSPWVKLDIELKSDRIYPLIAYNRVYIFWIETEEEKSKENGSETTKYKHKLIYCYTMEKGFWSKPRTYVLKGNSYQQNSNIILQVKVDNDVISIGMFSITKVILNCGDCFEEIDDDGTFDDFICNIDEKYIIYMSSKKNSEAHIYRSSDLSWFEGHACYSQYCRYDEIDMLFKMDGMIKFLSKTRDNIPNDICLDVLKIDENFNVDNAIKIDSNIYFFCSDKNGCIMIVAHMSQNDSLMRQVEFSICRLNYGNYCILTEKLFKEGINALYAQSATMEHPKFEEIYGPLASEIICTPSSKLEFHGPNKIYNWEIFLHIPHLIANCLNQNRKFEEASRWYQYIFDPNSQGQTGGWKFLPFINGNTDPMSNYLQDPEDVAVWINDPYNPHALARVRPGTYQKAIVLSYVDNLLDLADQEFARDTRESINHALGFYYNAQRLLKLNEIDNESCTSRINAMKLIIAGAVPWWRASELIDKLSRVGSLSPDRIEELYVRIENVANSIYSKDIRADIINDFLDAAIEEVENLPRSTLSDMMKEMDENIDKIMDDADDFIHTISDNAKCACIPIEWRNAADMDLPRIRLLANSVVGCIPENPNFEKYRNHIESNIRKIHSCRNIAGIQRIIPMYEASVNPMSYVKSVSSGTDFEDVNFSNAAGIGPYRFAYLIERSKSLANLVAQTGNALLLAIEKKESEELSYLRARQELNLTKANVHLRKLGVVESKDYQTLTIRQTERADIEFEHYRQLIEEKDQIQLEKDALSSLDKSIQELWAAQFMQAMVSGLLAVNAQITLVTNDIAYPEALASTLSSAISAKNIIAQIRSTESSKASMLASFERRREEWGLRKEIALKDYEISLQNETIAADRLAIAEMEQQIAEMTAEHADQMLEFLKEKFTNEELYAWMVKTLSKLLYGFYNLAYANAKMAQATLEFERNEKMNFISYGYWDSEKKGLLSGDQLLLDINRLDDYYINNNARKLEITKRISLSRMAPEALSALKSNGITTFATPMVWFDRDFPGHYQRIIKSVNVSIIALVGPTSGINATLSTISISRVVLDPENPVAVEVPRIQSVALSSATNASGLFELNYRDERYLPFEGCGVDVSWELEMPKPSNKFNFDSIMDVILTIDYTALSDSEYKKTVIRELGTTSGGIVSLSSKISFPDEWYYFNNPVFLKPRSQVDDPYKKGKVRIPYNMKLVITRDMFPPNEDGHLIESVAFLFSLIDKNMRIPVKIKYNSEKGGLLEVIELRTGENGYLAIPPGIRGLSPVGSWEISIDQDKAMELWAKKDDGTLRMENGSHVLDNEKIKDVLFAITYKSEIKWPEEITF